MVSMKDIASKCGVSVATVSKALNDHSDIGDDTKRLVKETAHSLGYFPNSSARALKTKRSYNIGVLFVDEGNSGLTHDYFSRVLDSFKQVAESYGYDITFINAKSQQMSYLEHTRYRGMDGVVIACVDFSDPAVLELVNSEIPVVTIDHIFDSRMGVASDNISGMRELVQYIYEQGHRKIAYIYGDDTAVTKGRLSSFYNTLGAFEIEAPDEYVIEAAYRNPELAGIYTKQLMQLKNPPTCIIYSDDYSALGGLSALSELGLSAPKDVSIAGYDGLYFSQSLTPKLTTYRQDTAEIGRLAAQSLISLIKEPKSTLIEQIMVSGGLWIGESVAKISL